MVRINKWLSEMGVCSRKQADCLIMSGQVLVNQQPASLGMKIQAGDQVMVKGEMIETIPAPIFLLYHKPVGVVCTHDLSVKNNIEQAVQFPQRVFAVGRLDKASEGLMLLTNQGDSVNKIMRAENHHQKVYRVWVDKSITDDFLIKMANGVPILNTVTLPCQVDFVDEYQDKTVFEISLRQGLNLQIRRMCKALGYRVLRLQRIKIMQFELLGLPLGENRVLDDEQIKLLQDSIENSINEV
ncbi:pseudouridine synthase [Thiomicrorhabdus immobilis]|uniref:Pseudouridine synthase n=1 Tax=Thiomicrorhabdus immobilis TaxID=2791037 RepID=A0ABN6CV35_9GAMM|nr:pseudouridine synthase [Thiomicrorhabdus immobilis]BCN92858.1 pseudouridine synthase [Thiomicrorhabdus immobilis]